MTERITSGQNPKIKALLALQEKSRERRKHGLFIVEGRREFGLCLAAGFVPDSVFYCPEIFGPAGDRPPSEVGLRPTPPPASPTVPPLPGRGRHVLQGVYPLPEETKIFEVTREIYEKIAYRGGTEGIIAEMKVRTLGLENLHLGAQPLVVVLESVEKPGNLGAVLRSADAAGADAVIVCDPLTDLFNPNLIRASLGALFTTQTVTATSEETIKWLKSNGFQIFTAQLQDSDPTTKPTSVARPPSCGHRVHRTHRTRRQAADRRIRIPMQGKLDSLNVSVSAAILLFEALRQRN